MTRLNPLMSSNRHDWRTPPAIFDPLHGEFGFTVDAAASADNALLPRYWTDAAFERWAGERVWCNPPYGREQAWFVERAVEADVAVLLIPARPDTRVWHDVIFRHAAEVRFMRGRIRFVGADAGAPFPSAIVVFRGRAAGPPSLKTATQLRDD